MQQSRGNRRRGAFDRVNSVLDRVVSGLGLDKRIRENAVLELWSVIAGEPWSHRSRSLFLDHERNLVISVMDASTGQELSLMKPQLLRRLKAAAAAIDVQVNGIRFDLKHYYGSKDPPLASFANPLPEPKDGEIDAVELSVEDQNQVNQLRAQLAQSYIRDAGVGISSERIVMVLERELKLRRWRKEHGYPVCKHCNIPVRTLADDLDMCQFCASQQVAES